MATYKKSLCRSFDGPCIDFEITTWMSFCHLEFLWGGEERDFGFAFALPGLALWISFRNFFPQSWRTAAYERAKKTFSERGFAYAYQADLFRARETGIQVHHGIVWFSLWSADEWSSFDNMKLPWNGNGWSKNFRVMDWILGKPTYEAEKEWEGDVQVYMPEGAYNATLTLERERNKRRWPLGRRWACRATIEVDGGVPIPGKGENSWDCDDDAIFSSSFPFDRKGVPMIERFLVEKFAFHVLKRRARYGSLSWRPRDGWPAHCERGEAG